MRGKVNHNRIPTTAINDQAAQDLQVDFDPEGKFARWMDARLEGLAAHWQARESSARLVRPT